MLPAERRDVCHHGVCNLFTTCPQGFNSSNKAVGAKLTSHEREFMDVSQSYKPLWR
jgi:hypothetical protein